MSNEELNRDNERVEARLDKLLNNLPCLVYRCRVLKDYNYVLEYASKGCEELLGLTSHELCSGRINYIERMTYPPDLRQLRQAVAHGIDTKTAWHVMYRLLLPNGVIKWVWDQGEAIYGANGLPLYLEGLIMDVSDQKFLEIKLQEENRQLKLSMENADHLGKLIGKSDAMRKVYDLILKASETDTNVIILGETGCGKDVVARTIHDCSGKTGAYVPVNCGAIPENLLESEFFGHVRGAFTGAISNKEGYLTAADNGTLFLDEVGELPLPLQVKFLRALESKSYTPVGGYTTKMSRFRLVVATNRDLAQMVNNGQMRADFYWRINVLPIRLAPLRERLEDLPLLIKNWEENNGIELKLSHAARVALGRHSWPGNVRELQNFLARFATFGESAIESLGGAALLEDPPPGSSLAEAVLALEEKMILAALEKCQWRRDRCAKLLGLNLRTLQRKMKNMGIGRGK